MASSSYRLPGVYSEETTGPFVNLTAGGTAVVALVGKAAGYVTASQRAEMSGFDEVPLNQGGVIGGSAVITSRTNGASYQSGVDFTEVTDQTTGVTTVRRRTSSLSLTKHSVKNREKTYYTAEPIFSIMVDETGADITGYPVCGTVKVVDHTDGDAALVEGVDYEIDYFNGTLGAVDNGKLATTDANDHVLYITFEWTTAEPIAMVGESAFSLSHDYISEGGLANGDSIKLVSCAYVDGSDTYAWGDTPGAADGYLEGIDFVIDYQTGRITRTSSSRIKSFDTEKKNYLYAEFAYDAIRDGEQVTITYAYTDDTYSVPQVVSSYAEAAQIYGSAWDSETGEVVSELSLGAYIAFQNGMSSCYLCAVRANVTVDTNEDGNVKIKTSYATGAWEEAFNSLTTVTGIDIVVPLTADASAIAFGQAHLVAMKNNQDERVMICGADGTDAIVPISALIARANGYNSTDVWFVGPSTVRFRNPIRSTVEILPGFYMAAAVAGYNSSVPQYTPLTRKAVSGFYSANEYATKVNKTNACANGVMYVDEVNGQLRVLHGTTTNTQSVVVGESNVTLTKYFLIKRLRAMFEDGYVGEIITDTTLMSIQSVMFSSLTSLQENSYIYSFSDLNVQIDDQLATQVNVTFMYVPVYGMNYIQISFAIDTSTGMTETELY